MGSNLEREGSLWSSVVGIIIKSTVGPKFVTFLENTIIGGCWYELILAKNLLPVVCDMDWATYKRAFKIQSVRTKDEEKNPDSGCAKYKLKTGASDAATENQNNCRDMQLEICLSNFAYSDPHFSGPCGSRNGFEHNT